MKIEVVSPPAKFTPHKLQISVETEEALQTLLSVCQNTTESFESGSPERDFARALRQVLSLIYTD